MTKNLKKYALGCIAAASMAMTIGCQEEIDTSARYTFKEHTIESYLASHDTTYSEYYKLLGEVKVSRRSESSVLQLMSARGNFTVFAPTNQAIHDYLDSLQAKGIISEPNWESFTDDHVLDSIRKVIVFNSIIDCGDNVEAYQTSSFPEKGEFNIANLNDRKLEVSYGKNPDSIYINEKSLIDLKNRDIPAINGYLHQVHSIIAPSNATMADILKDMIDDQEASFKAIAKMVLACGLADTLGKEKDENYENLLETGAIVKGTSNKRDYYLPQHASFGKFGYLPEHRYYGFTIFAEPDNVYEEKIGKPINEITMADLEALAQQYYPNALANGNYQDPKNALYQFVTYHILPMRLPANKLVIHYNEAGYNYSSSSAYTVPTWELYTTMGDRRLLKIYQAGARFSLEGKANIYVNRFPELDNDRQGTYAEVSCQPENGGMQVIEKNDDRIKSVSNGFIYPIEGGILAYDDATRTNFQKQRLRFDVAGLFPEWMNNDIRANTGTNDYNLCVAMPCSNDFNYCEDLEILEGSQFYYLSGRGLGWQNYQGDELNVTGRYEMIFRLPPVPKEGTYEIRYAVQTNSGVRGMCQVYFGSNKDNLRAMGIPLDLRMGGQIRKTSAGNFESIVGWEADKVGDDDYNAEVDKKMRNNGFMKGPRHYAGSPGSSSYARTMEYLTRRIIVREYMYPEKTYYLKFKSVLDDEKKEFYMDYLELCAKEVYDNPQTPEDIW